MKMTNMKSLKKLSIRNIIEWICPFYLCIGALQGITVLDNVHYVLGLLIQCFSIILFLIIQKVSRKHFKNYLLIVSIIGIITIQFMIKDIDIKLIVNRVFPLLSIFGITIMFDPILKINLKNIIKRTECMFVFVNIAMLFDILLQKFFKIGIWYPMNYLGNRYSGPFGDPNFAALYIVVTLFMVFGSNREKKRKLILGLMLGANLLFTGSLSAILLFIVVIFIRKIPLFRNRNILMTQIIIFSIYILLLSIWMEYDDIFMKYGIVLLQKIYNSVGSAQIKYNSLRARFEVQWKALRIGMRNVTGQGPRQIVPQLGRDTHNSYIGFFFEQGILGVILILNSLRFYKRDISEVSRCCFYFIILMALLLNVHYVTVYSILLVLLQVGEENKECDLPFECLRKQL